MSNFLTALLIYLLVGLINGICFVVELNGLEKTINHTISKLLTWFLTLLGIVAWPMVLVIIVMRFLNKFPTPTYNDTVNDLLYLDKEFIKDLEEGS